MRTDPLIADLRLYNDLVIETVRGMSAEELALRLPADDEMSSTSWPIWAITGHTAGTRVYWLCEIGGIPGAETTPFPNPSVGWEDDLEHPRSADALVGALTSTWAIVERALAIWSPALDETVVRGQGDASRHLTRRSVLLRIITHEAYHAGTIAAIQAVHGRPQLDLWPPGYHTVEAAAARATR